jgi:hypothetical protein
MKKAIREGAIEWNPLTINVPVSMICVKITQVLVLWRVQIGKRGCSSR